jgi:hypothetical protein
MVMLLLFVLRIVAVSAGKFIKYCAEVFMKLTVKQGELLELIGNERVIMDDVLEFAEMKRCLFDYRKRETEEKRLHLRVVK